MYKLIIVDDEQKTLDTLLRSVDWNAYGFEAVNTFCEAKSAYEYISSNPVDLILCDIYMPDITGIDFLKSLSGLHNPPMFIVLSAFREFEYAQEALRHGAFDYITKPVTEEKFSETLSRAKSTLDKYRLQAARNLSIKHMLVERILAKTVTDKAFIENAIAKSDLVLQNKCAPAIIVRASVTEFQKYHANNPEFYSPQQFQNSMYNLFEMIHPNIVIYNYSYNFIYFAIISPCKSYGDFISFTKEKLDEISNTSLEFLNTEFIFDIHNVISDIFDISNMPLELSDSLTMAVSDAMISKKHRTLNELCSSFIEKHKASPLVYEFLYFCLSLLVDTKLGLSADRFNDMVGLSSDSSERISKKITNLIDLCTMKASESEIKEDSKIVTNAQNFIRNNFKENIKMTIIAKEVHVSVSYLSRLFKKETGKSIVHYIKDIRLEYAKELLLTTDDSVESIAFNSGYRSRNLFNNDFKEKYGKSPRSFKNDITKEMIKFED